LSPPNCVVTSANSSMTIRNRHRLGA
jgi:hypothetical protein